MDPIETDGGAPQGPPPAPPARRRRAPVKRVAPNAAVAEPATRARRRKRPEVVEGRVPDRPEGPGAGPAPGRPEPGTPGDRADPQPLAPGLGLATPGGPAGAVPTFTNLYQPGPGAGVTTRERGDWPETGRWACVLPALEAAEKTSAEIETAWRVMGELARACPDPLDPNLVRWCAGLLQSQIDFATNLVEVLNLVADRAPDPWEWPGGWSFHRGHPVPHPDGTKP